MRPSGKPAGLELATFETRGKLSNHSAIELANWYGEIRKSLFNSNPDQRREFDSSLWLIFEHFSMR